MEKPYQSVVILFIYFYFLADLGKMSHSPVLILQPRSQKHWGMLKSFAFLCIGWTSVNSYALWRFRTKCLTNHLNPQLPFLRLEAVIAEVRKCSPQTHDSQINSLLVWKKATKHVVRYRFSSVFVLSLAQLSGGSTTVHYLQFIILTKREECGCESTNNSTPGALCFFSLY